MVEERRKFEDKICNSRGLKTRESQSHLQNSKNSKFGIQNFREFHRFLPAEFIFSDAGRGRFLNPSPSRFVSFNFNSDSDLIPSPFQLFSPSLFPNPKPRPRASVYGRCALSFHFHSLAPFIPSCLSLPVHFRRTFVRYARTLISPSAN